MQEQRMCAGGMLCVLAVVVVLLLGLASPVLAQSNSTGITCPDLNRDACRSNANCTYIDEALRCVARSCHVYDTYSLCAGDPEGFGDCHWTLNPPVCFQGGEPPCYAFGQLECPTDRCRVVSGFCEAQDSKVTRCSTLTSADCPTTKGCKLIRNECRLDDGSCNIYDSSTCPTSDGCRWLDAFDVCWPKGLEFPCEEANSYSLPSCPDHCDSVEVATDKFLCIPPGRYVPCSDFHHSKCPTERCDTKGTSIRVCFDPALPFDCRQLDIESCREEDACYLRDGTCISRDEPIPCEELSSVECTAAGGCRISCPGGGPFTCVNCTAGACKPDDTNCNSVDDCLGSSQEECEGNSACIWDVGGQLCVPDESNVCRGAPDRENCEELGACLWDGIACQPCPDGECPVPEGEPCMDYSENNCPSPRCTFHPSGECIDTTCDLALDNSTCLNLPGCAFYAPNDICYNATAGEVVPCSYVSADECETFDHCTVLNNFCVSKDDNKPCYEHFSQGLCPPNRCQWIYETRQCHSVLCSDIFDEDSCRAANCSFDAFSDSCYNATTVSCTERELSQCGPPCMNTGEACRDRKCLDAGNEEDRCALLDGCQFVDRKCVFDNGQACRKFAVEECPPRCYVDYGQSVCREELCSDQSDKEACEQLGCTYNMELSMCQNDTGLACFQYEGLLSCPPRCLYYDSVCQEPSCRFLLSEKCESNANGIRCMLYRQENGDEVCVPAGEPVPCWVYDYTKEEECPAERCKWNELDSLCENSTERAECLRFQHAETCQRFDYCSWTGACTSCKDFPCATVAPTTTTTTTTTTTVNATAAAATNSTATPTPMVSSAGTANDTGTTTPQPTSGSQASQPPPSSASPTSSMPTTTGATGTTKGGGDGNKTTSTTSTTSQMATITNKGGQTTAASQQTSSTSTSTSTSTPQLTTDDGGGTASAASTGTPMSPQAGTTTSSSTSSTTATTMTSATSTTSTTSSAASPSNGETSSSSGNGGGGGGMSTPGQVTTTREQQPSNRSSKGSNSAGVAAGVSVGVIVAVCIAALGYRHWRKRQSASLDTDISFNEPRSDDMDVNSFIAVENPTYGMRDEMGTSFSEA